LLCRRVWWSQEKRSTRPARSSVRANESPRFFIRRTTAAGVVIRCRPVGTQARRKGPRGTLIAVVLRIVTSSLSDVVAEPIDADRSHGDRSLSGEGGQRLADRIAPWAPAIVLAAVSIVSLLRSDVALLQLSAYSVYWIVTILIPGVFVVRAVFGPRRHFPHDLLLGGVTGLALQVAVWRLLRIVDLEKLTQLWWLPVLVVFVAVPALRPFVRHRYVDPVQRGWAWAMALLSTVVIMGADRAWFQTNPIPAGAGNVHRDMWWHSAIVYELLRRGPTQSPQVAGEPFAYHLNAHIHMSIGSQIWSLDPEVVLFRLWMIPVIILAIGMLAVLAAEVSDRQWTGPLAAWLTFVALGGGYLWSEFSNISTTPLRLASPSQLMAMPLVLAGAWACVRLVRGQLVGVGWLWFVLIAFVGAASKPTVIPVLVAGTGFALVATTIIQRRVPTATLVGFVALLALQGWLTVAGSDQASPPAILFGSLKSLVIYRDVIGDTTYRGINDGLVLDSLSGPRALFAGGVTILWLVGSQFTRVVGILGVVHPKTRRDPVTWWLVGAALVGWVVFFTIDLSSFGQLYFLHISLPFGAVLTSWLIAISVSQLHVQLALRCFAAGLAAGSVISIMAISVTEASLGDGFGTIDSVFAPLIVVVLCVGAVAIVWHRRRTAWGLRGAGLAFALAATVGVSLPTSISFVAAETTRWLQQELPPDLDEDAIEYVSPGEAEAARWLQANSKNNDVVASNSQCMPPTDDPRSCNAIGFWIGGISGRRLVLEGWGYTPEAHANHGVDGLHRNRQPSPWPERYDLSQDAIEDPTQETLDQLRDRFGTRWLFAVRRAGPVSDGLGELAELVFDNGDVAIYRLD